MGVDVKISLSKHAKTQQIFEVILKSMGYEFEKMTSNDLRRRTCDFNTSPSSKNPWYLRVVKNNSSEIKLSDVEYFEIKFSDLAGNGYSTLLHLEDEDEDYDKGKQLGPRSIAVWIALGKRLIDFFGGKLIYQDSGDWDDPKNTYICNEGTYPKKKEYQTSDDRWYQYYTALNELSILTVKEINDALAHAAYEKSDRDKSLIKYLEKHELAMKLEKNLVGKNLEPNQRKLKI